jgi:hypothetical protein
MMIVGIDQAPMAHRLFHISPIASSTWRTLQRQPAARRDLPGGHSAGHSGRTASPQNLR